MLGAVSTPIKEEWQRDGIVDVAKGLCILMIVSIHAEVFGAIHAPYPFIAVPMFFWMSGFFYKTNQPIKSTVVKDVKTLLLPAAFWAVICLCYAYFLYFLKGERLQYQFDVMNPCASDGPAWFLVALFYARIITQFIKSLRIFNRGGCFAALIVGYVGMHSQLWFYLDEGLAACPLYLFGSIAYPYVKQIYTSVTKKNVVVVGCTMILSFATYVCFALGLVDYTIVPLGNHCHPNYIVAVSAMLLCCPCVLCIASLLRNVKVLNRLGERTLGIMLVHAPMCHTVAVVLNRMLDKGSQIWISFFLVAYVIIVIVSYYLTVLLERHIPILLGKKKCLQIN